MHLFLSTGKLHRLGFTKDEIRRAQRCCLSRIARGRYVATSVCDDPRHRAIWSVLSEDEFEALASRGNMRDEMDQLRLLIRARAEKVNAASGRNRVTKGREVFSHISAALIHGLDPAYSATARVEALRPNVSRKYRYLHVRNRELPRDQTTVIGMYSATTLERTLVDVARDYELALSVALIDQAIRDGLTSRRHIADQVDRYPAVRGDGAVRQALALSDGRRESASESIAAVRFFEHGIEGFEPQVEFFDESGRVFARVDFCNVDAKVIVEVDGIEKYFMDDDARRKLAKEKARESALEARGYRVIRLTFGQLFQSAPFDHILNTVAARLRQR